MNRNKLSATLVGLATLALTAGQAGASTKFHNNSANTIWTMHAFASMTGLGCGWDDGCSGTGLNDWRKQGWWQIAPGGTVTVHGSGYGNAFHDAYAEDAVGHWWGNGGNNFGINQSAQDTCGDGITVRRVTFFRAASSRCCGIGCATNGTVTFNP
jgi:uncharacterized membrane protein